MTTINQSSQFADLSVGAIVARQPALARVFEKYKIDYCCQGNKQLAKACSEKQVDLQQVVTELELMSASEVVEPNWLERSLAELCDHIERRHHDYLRDELPRLSGLIDKVINAHGEKNPELKLLRRHFHRLRDELEPHMMKEERVLFPAIRQMESTWKQQQFPFGSVANPIHCMVNEHEHAGDELKTLRELTGNYTPPQDACPTWRVMLDSLKKLEQDMHEHVHKENSILFPRAQQLEQELAR